VANAPRLCLRPRSGAAPDLPWRRDEVAAFEEGLALGSRRHSACERRPRRAGCACDGSSSRLGGLGIVERAAPELGDHRPGNLLSDRPAAADRVSGLAGRSRHRSLPAQFTPTAYRSDFEEILAAVERMLYGYIKGQLVVALLIGLISGLAVG
jgi:hypothetical protein